MILDIRQTKTSFDMEWEIQDRHYGACAVVKAPFVRGRFEAGFTYVDGFLQRLYYNPSDTSFGRKLPDRLSFKLFEEGSRVGNLVGRTKKTGFLKAYPYYEFLYRDEMYYGYEVGFGKKGLFLCIYQGEKPIAIVDKMLRVVNFRDSYTAFLENGSFAHVVVPFVIYYDVTAYGDVMEVAARSVKEKRVYTVQKELIQKYDPSFIPRIMEMDKSPDGRLV